MRSEVEKDMNEKFERLQKEKEECEAKLLQKKKEIKDIEQTFIKQNNLIEKEKAILSEKLISLEDKKKEMQEQYEKELQNLSINLNINQKDILKERQEMQSSIEGLKKNVSRLEVELVEKNTLIEKNKILFDGKFQFIEQQRDNLKRESMETQKRFDVMLDTIQKKANSDKEKLETTHQNSISLLEQKYLTQIKEMQDKHQSLYSELFQSNKKLDMELKNLTMQTEIKNKSFDNSSLLIQIDELSNDRNRLRKDLETLRIEKDKKIIDIISSTEKEKEVYKLKAKEVDEKLKEIETKKKTSNLEFEIEKAKWSIEKDNLLAKNSEQADTIDRMEKKYETLLRENEKLKSDKNNANHKRSASRSGLNNLNNINNLNTSISNNNYFSTTNREYANRYEVNRPFNNLIGSISNNNPYNTNININKPTILDNSTNDAHSINSSRNFNEKSFEKYEPKIDTRYDKVEKIENTFGKYTIFSKPPIATKNITFKTKDDINSSDNIMTNSSFTKENSTHSNSSNNLSNK